MTKKKLKVINFFGGPGCGKSTMAAGLFYHLKVAGFKVELVTEYAKDMVYENRPNILEDQLYVLAKQTRRVSRLEGVLDFCITDSPLVLSAIYNKGSSLIDKLSLELFNGFDNMNFLICRSTIYQNYGREENEAEAIQIDKNIFSFLIDSKIKHDIIYSNESMESLVLKTVRW